MLTKVTVSYTFFLLVWRLIRTHDPHLSAPRQAFAHSVIEVCRGHRCCTFFHGYNQYVAASVPSRVGAFD